MRSKTLALAALLVASGPPLIVGPDGLRAQAAPSRPPAVAILAAPAPEDDRAGVRVVARVAPSGTIAYEPARPLTGTEVLAIQRALADAGHPPGPFDGRLGPLVSAALSRFQASAGLEPCGCIDGPTLEALGLRPRVVRTVVGAAADRTGPAVRILAPVRVPAPAAAAEAADAPAPAAGTEAAPPGGAAAGIPVLGLFPPGLARPGPAPAVASPRGGRPVGTPPSGRLIRAAPPRSRPPPR